MAHRNYSQSLNGSGAVTWAPLKRGAAGGAAVDRSACRILEVDFL